MKVWVVIWQDMIGCVEVCGVFSTLEKAEAFRNTAASGPDFYNDPVEVEIDEKVPI